MRYKFSAIVLLVAATLLVLVAPAAHADDGPGADLRTVPPNIAGLPTIFGALGSGNGDLRGLIFDYDLDGDGVYEIVDGGAVVEHTYGTDGHYRASLRVTDEFQRVSETAITFEVSPADVLGPPMFPAEGAPELSGTKLDRTTVPAGGTVIVTTPDGSDIGAALAPIVGQDDPWLTETRENYGGLQDSRFTVGVDIEPGDYWVLIVSDNQKMTQLSLTVTEPQLITPIMVGIGSAGAILVIAAVCTIIWYIRRPKRKPKRDEGGGGGPGRSATAAAVTIAVLLTGGAIALPVQPAHAEDDVSAEGMSECNQAHVVVLRGSGEPNAKSKYRNLDSGGWEGPTYQRLLTALDQRLTDDDTTAGRVVIHDLGPDHGYEAVSIETAIGDAAADTINHGKVPYSRTLWHIMASAKTGAHAAMEASAEIELANDICTNQFAAYLGYSQGAMASRMFWGAYPERIDAMLTIGDPLQSGLSAAEKQRAAGLYGSGAHGNGLYRESADAKSSIRLMTDDKVSTAAIDGLYTSDADRYLLCHQRDPFCDHNRWLGLLGLMTEGANHVNYFGVPDDQFKDFPHRDKIPEVAGAEAELAEVTSWLSKTLKIGMKKSTPAQPESISIGRVFTEVWAGWETRLTIRGVPASGSVNLELVPMDYEDPTDDPWSPDKQVVETVVATAGPVGSTGAPSIVLESTAPGQPGCVDSGTHGFIASDKVPGGTYWLRVTTTKGKSASWVLVLDPSVRTGWFWTDIFDVDAYCDAHDVMDSRLIRPND